jgi:transposase
MTRVEKARRAAELRREGLTYREIGERMGGAKQSTVHAWLDDPDGSKLKARKRGYDGTCRVCGGRTNGYAGPGKAGVTCASCVVAEGIRNRAAVVEAWNHGMTVKEIAARFGMGYDQVRGLVQFGRKKGDGVSLHRARNRVHWPTIEARWLEGATLKEIADELGVSAASVAQMMQTMRQRGIDLPKRFTGHSVSDETRAQVVEAYKAGLTYVQIHEQFGVSYGTINATAKAAGLPRRRRA